MYIKQSKYINQNKLKYIKKSEAHQTILSTSKKLKYIKESKYINQNKLKYIKQSEVHQTILSTSKKLK